MKNLICILLFVTIFSFTTSAQTEYDRQIVHTPDLYILSDSLLRLEKKARKVLEISDSISTYFGDVRMYSPDFIFTELYFYDITRQERFLPNIGWVDLFEIIPKNAFHVGFSNSVNPYWIKAEGIATINLPPEVVVNYIFKALKNLENK